MSEPDPSQPSHIDEIQNTLPLRKLLMARFEIFAIAERWQRAQLALVVVVPLLGAAWAIACPSHRSAIGALAVCITILDVAFLDRRYRKAIRAGAKGAEHFDSKLFQLPWNGLSAGPPLSAEELERHYQAWLAKRGDKASFDWYPKAVGRAPLHIARVICQRANVSYDSALRRHFASYLIMFVSFLSAVIFIVGFWRSATLAEVVITALVPPAPILIWALREFFRQTDAADANDSIQRESEAIINSVFEGKFDELVCTQRSIQMQSALFIRRATNPLLFNCIYKLRRRHLEAEMDAGAEYWLAKAGYPE